MGHQQIKIWSRFNVFDQQDDDKMINIQHVFEIYVLSITCSCNTVMNTILGE